MRIYGSTKESRADLRGDMTMEFVCFEEFLRIAQTSPLPHHQALINNANVHIAEIKQMNSAEIRDAMQNIFGHTNVEEAMRAVGFGGKGPQNPQGR